MILKLTNDINHVEVDIADPEALFKNDELRNEVFMRLLESLLYGQKEPNAKN